MKRLLILLSIVTMGIACHVQNSPIAPHSGTVIDFKDSVSRSDIQKIANEYNLDIRPNSIEFVNNKITITSVNISDEVKEELLDSDLIESIEKNIIVSVEPLQKHPGWDISSSSGNTYTPTHTQENFPNDPLYLEGKQWNFDMIGMPAVWADNRVLGDGVIVAILDTGLSDGKHKAKRVPDLAQTCIMEGYSFVNDSIDTYDKHSHGTHVAGTVAQSTNNGIGVTGLAPKACILPVKVLSDEGQGTLADIADGIYFATDAGAHVINMSLGTSEPSPVLAKAIEYAAEHNVFVVCAAGNRSRPNIDYPAGHKGCHAISAIDKTGNLAWYSSYGKSSEGQNIFLTAPGGSIKGADDLDGGIWQDTVDSEDINKHGYFPFQGTSMASPHVAGVAALVISSLGTSNYKVADIESILISTATDKGDNEKFGSGLINADAATLKAKEQNDNKAWSLGSMLVGLLILGGLVVSRIYRK